MIKDALYTLAMALIATFYVEQRAGIALALLFGALPILTCYLILLCTAWLEK